MREQKDRIKAITHERKPNIEELRSRLNADAAVNRGGRVKAKYHLTGCETKTVRFVSRLVRGPSPPRAARYRAKDKRLLGSAAL